MTGMLPKIIVVPTDFSPCAEQALDYACQIAQRLGATIHLVNAIGPTIADLPLTASMTEGVTRERSAALDKLADPRRAIATFGPPQVKVADPRDAILSTADTLDADLIVIGTHGRRGISRLVLGSVAEDVVRRASCPVLTVRTKKLGGAS